jgi:hypothetical protein
MKGIVHNGGKKVLSRRMSPTTIILNSALAWLDWHFSFSSMLSKYLKRTKHIK